jgi:hypothetical protein
MPTFLKPSSLIVAITLFTLSFANAQKVRVIDNKGTISKVRNNNVYTTDTNPNILSTIALENDIWIDTSTTLNNSKIWDGTQWVKIETGPSVYTGSFRISAPGGNSNTSFQKVIGNLPFLPSQINFVAYTNIEDFPTDNDKQGNTNSIQNTAGTMNGFVRNDDNLGIIQQVIFIGTHGRSTNNISRYASNSNCLGLRYTNKNGENLGVINAVLTSFDTNLSSFGFSLNINYIKGTSPNSGFIGGLLFGSNSNDEIFNENLIVFFTVCK